MWSRKNNQYIANETTIPNGCQFTLSNGCDSALDDILTKVKGVSRINLQHSTHIEGRPANLNPKVDTVKYLGTQIKLNMTTNVVKKQLMDKIQKYIKKLLGLAKHERTRLTFKMD